MLIIPFPTTENAMWCPHCADRSSAALARRIRVLQLLALIEHADALPRTDALRIAGELLAWLDDRELNPAAPEAAGTERELQPA